MGQYPKRLIEVDLPIKRISAHARREKSIRHGHISTLHIWWARRPLAACRAVICASLWPDPADELCPASFRKLAREQMQNWAKYNLNLSSDDSSKRFIAIHKDIGKLKDNLELRKALLDFIADFANWDNSTVKEYLETSRALTQSAHESLGGSPGTRPLVVDPFAGGGAIPLEALRVGADAFASDLNPVAVLLNKVVIEYIPKYGKQLANEVRTWGKWIKDEAEKQLGDFYSIDPDGSLPIAYLWARTIQCEGPGCGAQVPLIRSLWLAKKSQRSVAMQLVPNLRAKRVEFQIIIKQRSGWVDQADSQVKVASPNLEGTVKRGSATCPCCGYTTPVARVRDQLRAREGGAKDARLFCVVTAHRDEKGRFYRLPTKRDLAINTRAEEEIKKQISRHCENLSLVPNETLPIMSGVFNAPIYGHNTWGSLFTPRQQLVLTTLVRLVQVASKKLENLGDLQYAEAVKVCLALALDRQADFTSALCAWWSGGQKIQHTFARQALPMIWDFVECPPLAGYTGSWEGAYSWGAEISEHVADSHIPIGQVALNSATHHPLPNDSVNAFITDPPYYNAVPYADLSDFFYVWLKRTLRPNHSSLLSSDLSPKADECCEMAGWDSERYSNKDASWFESQMKKAMEEGRRLLETNGVGCVVFAHKSTVGWEAQLQAMVDAGWIMTGSWPIDTEMGTRLRALNSAALASSVHLICRPRETLSAGEVGSWRDILQELPLRIREWMPRLAEEGVVGADAIFACLGPALEIFSRYDRVDKASGETVTLKEYLEHVWAAVAKEALNMIFEGADATGFEEDARLTAMWLWTLKTGDVNGGASEEEENMSNDEDSKKAAKTLGGFALEYDAARKIAQGLGAHLENLTNLVMAKGETAVLISVSNRSRYLFGKDSPESSKRPAKKKAKQMQLGFEGDSQQLERETESWIGELKSSPGRTVLDQLHQSMILFAAGRSEALKRFIVEDGIGRNPLYWRLAQALSALYPSSTDEKRWVDGVLARKKGFGF